MSYTESLNFVADYEAYSRIRSSKGVALLNFGAPWSAACNIQNNITGRVAMLFKDKVSFCSIDIDNMPQAKSEFDIHNIPTVVILKNGKEVKRFSGVQPEKTLAAELNAVTGFYKSDKKGDILWENILDREREKLILHKEIMIVDDDPDITFCVITILKEAKFHNIAIADSHDRAFKHLKQSTPDLIFLNISMRNKEGNRTLLMLRRNKEWRSIPILVSVGPLEPTRVYEDSFKDAAILKHGKYVEHPSTRESFIGLVRHMLLYGMEEAAHESHVLNIGDICPTDRKGM